VVSARLWTVVLPVRQVRRDPDKLLLGSPRNEEGAIKRFATKIVLVGATPFFGGTFFLYKVCVSF